MPLHVELAVLFEQQGADFSDSPISSTKIAIKYCVGLGCSLSIGIPHRIRRTRDNSLAAVAPGNLVHVELPKATIGDAIRQEGKSENWFLLLGSQFAFRSAASHPADFSFSENNDTMTESGKPSL